MTNRCQVCVCIDCGSGCATFSILLCAMHRSSKSTHMFELLTLVHFAYMPVPLVEAHRMIQNATYLIQNATVVGWY